MTLTLPLSFLAAVLAVGVPVVAQQDPLALDRKGQKNVSALAERFWRARPETQFRAWDEAERAAILKAASELGVLPDGKLDEVVALLWQPVSEFGPGIPKAVFAKSKRGKKRGKKGKKQKKQKRPAWLPKVGKPLKKSKSKSKSKGKRVTIDTPYGEAWFFLDNVGPERGLILGLHGGGEGAGSASEPRGTWRSKDCIGMYPQGIRLVHDTWNTVHGERFLLTMIEIAKAHFEVDPDRVYSMGFSMGGSGSWFMAGRHADLLAGAAPCAGVLMASPKSQLPSKEDVLAIQHGLVPNVRNLAMYYYIGLSDRNCMPGTYLYVADMLEKLRVQDEGGYSKIRFETYEGLAHAHPPGEPGGLLDWLPKQKRETFPKTVVWETATEPFPQAGSSDKVDRLQKQSFYWLGAKELGDAQKVRATIDGNTIELDVQRRSAGVTGLIIYLNDKMIDPKQDVIVRHGGQEIYKGKPIANLAVVLESLDARVDRSMVFDRKIEL